MKPTIRRVLPPHELNARRARKRTLTRLPALAANPSPSPAAGPSPQPPAQAVAEKEK